MAAGFGFVLQTLPAFGAHKTLEFFLCYSWINHIYVTMQTICYFMVTLNFFLEIDLNKLKLSIKKSTMGSQIWQNNSTLEGSKQEGTEEGTHGQLNMARCCILMLTTLQKSEQHSRSGA